mmetsp:Transcript_36746/g.118121  ORF Transcript_36746/g.118121 Transcript_36746/m.118121 type:complete len:301 (-) Transcript_36746:4598-5500(-)|eukprot:scaffold7123_cov119-Isochrysis_galbana.AAC.9
MFATLFKRAHRLDLAHVLLDNVRPHGVSSVARWQQQGVALILLGLAQQPLLVHVTLVEFKYVYLKRIISRVDQRKLGFGSLAIRLNRWQVQCTWADGDLLLTATTHERKSRIPRVVGRFEAYLDGVISFGNRDESHLQQQLIMRGQNTGARFAREEIIILCLLGRWYSLPLRRHLLRVVHDDCDGARVACLHDAEVHTFRAQGHHRHDHIGTEEEGHWRPGTEVELHTLLDQPKPHLLSLPRTRGVKGNGNIHALRLREARQLRNLLWCHGESGVAERPFVNVEGDGCPAHITHAEGLLP